MPDHAEARATRIRRRLPRRRTRAFALAGAVVAAAATLVAVSGVFSSPSSDGESAATATATVARRDLVQKTHPGKEERSMHNALSKLIHRHHFANAEAYDRRAGTVFRGVYRRVAEDVAAAASPGAAVLDAGCGSGRLAIEIARRRPDLRVHGIDLEPRMVEMATRHAERGNLTDRVQFTVADLADLPLPDNSVDMIVSTASMHHWTDVGAVIASLDRVLQPQASMCIYDMRWVPAGSARTASAGLDRRVDRAVVRTGWFPAALFQRLAIEPPSPGSSHGGSRPIPRRRHAAGRGGSRS
jgi:ubiquinone/menaquinone biosynthesis C-methylase UbiE